MGRRFFELKSNILRLYPPAGRYLVAVSGGRDSVGLLHWLIESGYKNLIVCHLNHRLRGRAGEADARLVAKLAAKHGAEFELKSTDVRALAAKKKMSVETAARTARYEFFAEMAKRRRCRTIFTAHHADDQVETFLINLLRGAGATGLAAMREISTRRVNRVEMTILRPFLHLWRSDINKYVKKHRLKFREDASNKDLTPLRNRMRQRIIPYLEKTVGRNIRQNIWRTAAIMAEEENFFETLLPDRLLDRPALAIEPLRQMSLAVQRRLLHKWLRAGDVADVGFDLVERVRGLLDVVVGVAKTNLPGNRHARRKAGKLFLE